MHSKTPWSPERTKTAPASPTSAAPSVPLIEHESRARMEFAQIVDDEVSEQAERGALRRPHPQAP